MNAVSKSGRVWVTGARAAQKPHIYLKDILLNVLPFLLKRSNFDRLMDEQKGTDELPLNKSLEKLK